MSTVDKEFEEFKSHSESPAPGLGEAILTRVRQDLNPNAWRVFSKLALIYFAMSLVILSFCPQFGVRIYGEGEGLMPYFMSLGEYGCMVGCGAFFLGSTAVLAAILLRREELRILRKSHVLAFGVLGLLSLGVFAMAHAEIVLGLAAAWFVGSVLASSVGFEFVAWLRLRPSLH
jgi:hypothetical protein